MRPPLTRLVFPQILIVAAIIAAVLPGGSSAALGQIAPGTPPADPPPTAVDSTDAQLLHAQFADLLKLLQANRVDYSADPLSRVMEKHNTIRAVLEKHEQDTLRHFVNPELIAANYVQFLNATAPRLSGRIVRVGPGGEYPDLAVARAAIQPGDLICLGEGSFALESGRKAEIVPWTDVAIVGAGPGKTTLTGQIRSAQRLRVEGVAVNCDNDEFVSMRDGGTLHLRDCSFSGYNSGAGGSNAVYGNDCVILVERCVFEGLSGRASRPDSNGGCAFDLRGFNLLYVRQAQFVDNTEIIRATFPCVFEGCSTRNVTANHAYGIMPYPSGLVLHRRNEPMLKAERNTAELAHATDDPEFVRLLLGEPGAADEPARTLAGQLGLAGSLPYWIGLLRHENADIRASASRQVEKLTGQPVSLADSTGLGECPNPIATPLAAEREYTRLITWYEQTPR